MAVNMVNQCTELVAIDILLTGQPAARIPCQRKIAVPWLVQCMHGGQCASTSSSSSTTTSYTSIACSAACPRQK